MDCERFRRTWEPGIGPGTAGATRCQRHAASCGVCQEWMAEQAAVDAFLQTDIRVALESPVVDGTRDRVLVNMREHIPALGRVGIAFVVPEPRGSVFLAQLSYAAAATLTAAAMLVVAVNPGL